MNSAQQAYSERGAEMRTHENIIETIAAELMQGQTISAGDTVRGSRSSNYGDGFVTWEVLVNESQVSEAHDLARKLLNG